MNEREMRKLLDRIEIKYLHLTEEEEVNLDEKEKEIKLNIGLDTQSISHKQVFKLTAAQK